LFKKYKVSVPLYPRIRFSKVISNDLRVGFAIQNPFWKEIILLVKIDIHGRKNNKGKRGNNDFLQFRLEKISALNICEKTKNIQK
jgi:hypothetical protein